MSSMYYVLRLLLPEILNNVSLHIMSELAWNQQLLFTDLIIRLCNSVYVDKYEIW